MFFRDRITDDMRSDAVSLVKKVNDIVLTSSLSDADRLLSNLSDFEYLAAGNLSYHSPTRSRIRKALLRTQKTSSKEEKEEWVEMFVQGGGKCRIPTLVSRQHCYMFKS